MVMPKSTEETRRREATSINVDPELWKKAKIQAISEGTTLTKLFEEALEMRLKDAGKLERLKSKVSEK